MATSPGCGLRNWQSHLGHKDLTHCSPPTIRFQLLRTQQKLDEMLGYHYPLQLLRPPYGNTNGQVARAAQSIGYQWVINWDVSLSPR